MKVDFMDCSLFFLERMTTHHACPLTSKRDGQVQVPGALDVLEEGRDGSNGTWRWAIDRAAATIPPNITPWLNSSTRDAPSEHHDEQDEQDDTDKKRWSVSPALTVRQRWQSSYQCSRQHNQDDDFKSQAGSPKKSKDFTFK